MATLLDHLWNWGHLEGSHNLCTGLQCTMTPEEFAEAYGIKNAFLVSYGGNIQPPFHDMAKRLSGLNQIKWSVLGDASTPLPDDELGNTKDILEVLEVAPNISGGIVDDFFHEPRMSIYTPDVLLKIRQTMNAKNRDFWCVLYEHQLDLDLQKYLGSFDGVTFWLWNSDSIKELDSYLEKIFKLVGDKPLMLGVYLWDYGGQKDMDPALFEIQIKRYFELIQAHRIQGVIFCSGCIGDADLETNRILKKYIAEYGSNEI